ncbi:phosphatase [Sporolituus thermophilus]|uniref:Putative hydrolase n=1 Tax=Sporolituus thermophilus DSM 23256 TaxID=1123285 RepID=A0A1G7N3V6_9FIRM|nr:phosphatase [Sporolituus thermophilus]SDF68723.1 putative hydrolase [Sporolituus thermophilus DSM 23256]
MQFVADLHVHTVASGHAYSTVLEIARAAADRKLAMIALTDHGPGMPGGPHPYHFSNQVVIPAELFGVRILKGIEANVMDRDGRLDLDEGRLAKMDIVLAGLHTHCAPYGTVEENTTMMINAMKNPWVDVIVHPGNPEYQVDPEAVVKAAVHYDVALEINNSSLTVSRRGSAPHCHTIAGLAKTYGAKLIVGSDSHFAWSVGDFGAATALLAAEGIGPEMVLNTSLERIYAHLRRRTNRRHSL